MVLFFSAVLPVSDGNSYFWSGGANPNMSPCYNASECRGRFSWGDGTHVDPALVTVNNGNDVAQCFVLWTTPAGDMIMSCQFQHSQGYLCQWDCGRVNKGEPRVCYYTKQIKLSWFLNQCAGGFCPVAQTASQGYINYHPEKSNYYKLHTSPLNYGDAKAVCKSEGSSKSQPHPLGFSDLY